MNYELIWAFRQAVGLSAISLLALPAPISRSQSRSQSPFPAPAWLAKDAAPIPNAMEILELKTLTIKEISKSS